MPLRTVSRLLTAALLTLILLIVPSQATAATPTDLAVSINQLRYEQHLPYLAGDWTLDRYAQTHAERLATTGILHHSDISSLLGRWVWVGENIGIGHSVWGLVETFATSPTHWANIVGDYTHLGVGLVDVDGRLYVVAVFAR